MTDVLAGGRYTIVRRLAQGGMGEVLLADFVGDQALELSRGLLVLKRVLSQHPSRDYQARMLREEGRIALRLLHDNLVESFFVDEHEGDPLLVMEYLSGRAMSQVLGQAKKRREHVPVDVALALLRGSACGLHFAHTLTESTSGGRPLGLIHRDVSPANLFLTFDGRVKVIDFGVAKAEDSEIRTSTGILKGKIGYMSPEHAFGGAVTTASDLWSLGVCFWETLCADRLFSNASPSATLTAISEKPIPLPNATRPDLPAGVVALCMRLLDRNVDSRIGTGAELVHAIDALPEAAALPRVDIGGWLSGRFPGEAEQGKSEAARAAKMRRRTPVPIGLVEGTANMLPDEVAPTVVMSAALAAQARSSMGGGAEDAEPATIQVTFQANDDEALTRRMGARPGLLADAEEASEPSEARTAIVGSPVPSGDMAPWRTPTDDRPATLPPPPKQAAPPAPVVVPREPSGSQRRAQRPPPLSWVAVALSTFGTLALVMGIGFSFLAPPQVSRGFAVASDAAGQNDVVMAARDAPPHARPLDVTQTATLKRNGAVATVSPQELASSLAAAGVTARASLPTTTRATLVVLLPALIASLGLLALCFALPSILVKDKKSRLFIQLGAVLVGAALVAVLMQLGGLGWPGLAAFDSVPHWP